MTGHRGALATVVRQRHQLRFYLCNCGAALHRGEGATMPGHLIYGEADSDPPPCILEGVA